MADINEWTIEETRHRLKEYYDGYHFSRHSTIVCSLR